MEDRKTIVEKALTNVSADRQKAQNLFDEAFEAMQKQNEHSRIGPVAAKSIEALQRSNDQLIKLIAELSKMEKEENVEDGFDMDAFEDDEE
jgi:hypothetical protein